MTKNNTFVFLIILLLSFGMIGGSYYLVNQTKILRQTETNLRIQKKKAELRIDEKMRQIEVYKRAIAQLERQQEFLGGAMNTGQIGTAGALGVPGGGAPAPVAAPVAGGRVRYDAEGNRIE